jgi:hypothetical protein
MVSQIVVGGLHMSSRDSQIYFDMMVIVSIFAHRSVSIDISRIINFTDTKRSHYTSSVLSFVNIWNVFIWLVMKCFILHVLY